MRTLLHQLTYSLSLSLVLWLTATAAQQQAPGKPRAPRLTTDDVVRQPTGQPLSDSKETVAKPEETAKTEVAEPKANLQKSGDSRVDPEESSWRDRVGKARDRAKELERVAEEAELRITALRNELGVSGQSARQRNDTAAEIGLAGERLSELRAQARIAAEDAAQLVEYGRQKGFAEAQEPKPTVEEGKPNEEYYRSQFSKLTENLESARRRVQLYDNRIRDLSQQLATNSGGKDKNGRSTGGDSFFAIQLQKEREEAQQKLDEARAAYTQAQTDLDALKEDARRAGVPPGVFR